MDLWSRILAAPTLGCALPFRGFVRYREANPDAAGAPRVLLHGIGAGSGSWMEQLSNLPQRVLAWDAPGYADSTPLASAEPQAADYAQVLWAWLDQLGVYEVHLVGHSLGCVMGAAATRLQAARVRSLTLLAPAQGYARATPEVRERKRDERLQAVQKLGLARMARERAPRLLAAGARPEHIAATQGLMTQLNEGGYAQATAMLSNADIRADLAAIGASIGAVAPGLPIRVACGALDAITPPEACEALAQAFGLPYESLGPVGHMGPIEASTAVCERLAGLDS